jgi:acyl-CoA oxidase
MLVIDAYQDIVPAQTYEGENTVMYLQTARYLMKFAKLALSGKKPANVPVSVAYLFDPASTKEKSSATSPKSFANVNTALHALRARAAAVVFSTAQSLAAKVKSGLSESKAWDASLINLSRASQAHAAYLLAYSFIEGLKKRPSGPQVSGVLKSLVTVYAGNQLEKYSGELQEVGYFSGKQSQYVREYNQDILAVLRKDIIALADAWDFSDYLLNSALGRYDGNVYEDMYNWAQGSRLNIIPVDQEVRKYLKPLPKAANL